jgi:hypothetical protein
MVNGRRARKVRGSPHSGGPNRWGASATMTLPRFHVQQEVDNFEGTENRNERRQAAEEAVHRGI